VIIQRRLAQGNVVLFGHGGNYPATVGSERKNTPIHCPICRNTL
jgi:hypothetical protein